MTPDRKSEVVQLGVAAANKSMEYIAEVLGLKPGQVLTEAQAQELFSTMLTLLAHHMVVIALQHRTDEKGISKLAVTAATIATEWFSLYKNTLAEDEQKGQDHAVVS